jgi:hypothetical protein
MLSAVDGRLDPIGQPAARALIKGLRSRAATCNATGLLAADRVHRADRTSTAGLA